MLLALAFPLVAIALQVISPPPPQPAPKKETAAIPLGDIAQRAARIAVKTAGLTESDAEIEHLATRAREAANARFSLKRMVDEIEKVYLATDNTE